MSDIYVLNGYRDRDDYINDLAESYDCDPQIVHEISLVLGPDEDFDGLPVALEDYFDSDCEEEDYEIQN